MPMPVAADLVHTSRLHRPSTQPSASASLLPPPPSSCRPPPLPPSPRPAPPPAMSRPVVSRLSLVDALSMVPSTLGRLCHEDDLAQVGRVSKGLHRLAREELRLAEQRERREDEAATEAVRARLAAHQATRAALSAVQRVALDHEVVRWWSQMSAHPLLAGQWEQVADALLHAFALGGRLECQDYELGPFNLGQLVADTLCQEWIYAVKHPTADGDADGRFYARMAELAEGALITNPALWRNRRYVGNGGVHVLHALVHDGVFHPWRGQLNVAAYRAAYSLLEFLIRLLHVVPQDQVLDWMRASWLTTTNVDDFLFRECLLRHHWPSERSWAHPPDRVVHVVDSETTPKDHRLEARRLQRRLTRRLSRAESRGFLEEDTSQAYDQLLNLPYERLDLLLILLQSPQWLSTFRSVPAVLLRDGLLEKMIDHLRRHPEFKHIVQQGHLWRRDGGDDDAATTTPALAAAASSSSKTSSSSSSASAPASACSSSAPRPHPRSLAVVLFHCLRGKDRTTLTVLLRSIAPATVAQVRDAKTGCTPLEYLVAHVRGCRHRIFELLLCDAVQAESKARASDGSAGPGPEDRRRRDAILDRCDSHGVSLRQRLVERKNHKLVDQLRDANVLPRDFGVEDARAADDAASALEAPTIRKSSFL